MKRPLSITFALVAVASFAQQSTPYTKASVIAAALKRNPAILLATQKVQEAQAHLKEMIGQGKFQLTASGSATGSTGRVAQPLSNQSFGAAEASLISPIPNTGKTSAQVEQAKAQLEVAQAGLRRALLDIEFRSADAYFELLRAREAKSIAQQNLDQATRQAADTQMRIDAGDVPAADLLKAQVPVAQDRAALTKADIAVTLAEETLNDLIQKDLNTPAELAPLTDSEPPKYDQKQAVEFANANAPDILEAEADVRGAEANLRSVRHDRDPDFSFQLSHALSGDPTAYSYLTSLSLNVSLPIADGGVAKQQKRQAQSQLDQAKTSLKLARQQTRVAVQEALLQVKGNRANLEATAATASIAKQSLDKARQSYGAGLTTTRDVLDAQLVYSQALIDLNSAKYDLAVSLAKLKQIVGGSIQ